MFTKKDLTDYLQKNIISQSDGFVRAKRVTCADGMVMSVQASEGHYCWPREDLDYYDYAQFEVGFPSSEPVCFSRYAEDPDDLTGTVYGYVPVELIVKEINMRGGLEVENESK